MFGKGMSVSVSLSAAGVVRWAERWDEAGDGEDDERETLTRNSSRIWQGRLLLREMR